MRSGVFPFLAIVSFLLRLSGAGPDPVSPWKLIVVSRLTYLESIMNAELVKAATEVVHNQQILVNIVSRRVRQLSLGIVRSLSSLLGWVMPMWP